MVFRRFFYQRRSDSFETFVRRDNVGNVCVVFLIFFFFFFFHQVSRCFSVRNKMPIWYSFSNCKNRFFSNPDSQLGFSAFYGIALICESWSLFSLAALGQILAHIFVLVVERPHMRRKYSTQVRGRSGAASALLQIIKEETGEVVQKAKKIMSQLEMSPGKKKKDE